MQLKSSVADLGCLSRIPDPNFFHPGSRVQGEKDSRIPDPYSHQRISILTQKVVSKLSEIWSGMFIPDPDLDFLPIPNPESRDQEGSGSCIRIRNLENSVYVWIWWPTPIFARNSLLTWMKSWDFMTFVYLSHFWSRLAKFLVIHLCADVSLAFSFQKEKTLDVKSLSIFLG